MIFNPTHLLINSFVDELKRAYVKQYGGMKKAYCEILGWAGSMALEIISNTNALYHNVEHTVLVTLVGQEILKGVHIKKGGVSCEIWLNAIISLLVHDIGMIRGVCKDDCIEKGIFASGKNGELVQLPKGCTDASLSPYHVDRGKLFVQERFGDHSIINAEIIKSNIELTRFPVPKNRIFTEFQIPEIVRAADLIGQLGDLRYIQKSTALYYEFEEIGANKKLGYTSPDDLVRMYPTFFWKCVFKLIKPALEFLNLTVQGKMFVASLYANVFRVEHSKNLDIKEIEEDSAVSFTPLHQKYKKKNLELQKKCPIDIVKELSLPKSGMSVDIKGKGGKDGLKKSTSMFGSKSKLLKKKKKLKSAEKKKRGKKGDVKSNVSFENEGQLITKVNFSLIK